MFGLNIKFDPLGDVGGAVDSAGLAGGPADGLSDLQVLDNALAALPPIESHEAPVSEGPGEVDEPDVEAIDVKEKPAPVVPQAPAAPVEEPAAEPEATPEAKDGEVDTDDVIAGLSISSLNKHIAKSPEFKAMLAKDPEFKKQLFYTSRRAERAGQYDELFETPALAKEVKTAADEHYQNKTLFESSPEKFLQKLVYDGLEKNEDGTLKMGANGIPVSTGAYESAMTHYRSEWYGALAGEAHKLIDSNRMVGDITGADALEAIRIIQILTEGKSNIPAPGQSAPSAPAADVAHGKLSPEVQAQLNELAALKAEKVQSTQQSLTSFKEQVSTSTRTAIETDVKNLLAKRLPKDSALSDYLKEKIISDTVDAVVKSSKSNNAHQDVLGRAVRGASRDKAGIDKLVSIEQAYAKELIPRTLSQILSKATPGVMAQVVAASQKIDGQVNRREVNTSGGVRNSPTRPDVRQVARDLDSNARKAGKTLSDEELVDQVVAAQRR